MQLLDIISSKINGNPNFFIIDSGNYEKDNDFVEYEWQRSKNNKIKEGDWFIYRKPQKLSANGQFYLYGVGQFVDIMGDDAVVGKISNAHPFDVPVLQEDLADFTWEWKKRGETWEHYWGQYGINQITKNDFIKLISLVDGTEYSEESDDKMVEYEAKIAQGDFYIADEHARVKVRSWQRAWSLRVKDNYGFQCAICEVKTPSMLIGSHIIPVGADSNNRTNPSNGIALCVVHDAVFDAGLISIMDGVVVYSSELRKDKQLNDMVRLNVLKRVREAKFDKVNPEFLKYHRLNIFKP